MLFTILYVLVFGSSIIVYHNINYVEVINRNTGNVYIELNIIS